MNRYRQLDAHPEGNDFASALSLQHAAVPDPADGQILIRNHYLSMDAGTRMWMTGRTDGYQPPLPLGAPMVGLVIGRIERSRHSGFPQGRLVRAFGHWADYSCVDPVASGAFLLDEQVGDVREHLGALGMNGWSALWGIERTGAARPGETVLVSAAAGGAETCACLTEGFGIDGAFDCRSGGLAARLRAWLDAGRLRMPFDVTQGLENTLNAYARLFSGANIGKTIVEIEA